MKTVLIKTDKKSGTLEAFSVLTTLCEQSGVPYQTVANPMAKNDVYENDSMRVERLEIKR